MQSQTATSPVPSYSAGGGRAAGGSNGSLLRAWKVELAALAAVTGLDITVCRFPPGTSKWNKIERRLFVFHLHELARPPLDRLPGTWPRMPRPGGT
jgi:hypothetical protein